MVKGGKKYRESIGKVDQTKLYAPDEALDLVKEVAKAKFDETIELHILLGIDPKRSDQNVRGTVVLPYGTGKTPKVIAFAKGDKAKEAEQSGADEVGAEELIQKVKSGWSDFEIAVATPDMMGQIGSQLGKILGPRMPNPKAGTVALEIGKAVKELKSGKVQFRIDKQGIVHVPIGKASFEKDKLLKNFTTLIEALLRSRPPAAKGQFLKTITLTSTMGPGIKLDGARLSLSASEK
ncbi:MAG: 50S ribosomal protein L1 [Firmicutes bacterium]|nr:50S ribosomal protein L1 [Bacillota bacterium]